MKTIKNMKKGILMVALLTASLSYANNISALIVKKELKRTALVLEYVKEGELISIKDDSGLTLYKEIIKSSGIYNKGFDLTALPNGDYFFELDTDVEIKTIPFSVKSSEVTFDKTKETIIFKPITRIKGDLIYVSKLDFDLKPMKIDLYYQDNSGAYKIINTETIYNTKLINRIYKLSHAHKGNYKIVCHTNDKEFIKHIEY